MKTITLRSVRRFWRGLSGQMRAALVLVLAVVLLLAGFGVYMLAGGASSDVEYVQTLFPGVDRAQISSIVMHTKSGEEYTIQGSVSTTTNSMGETIKAKRFYLVTADGIERHMLTINSMQLSNLVVGTGQNYVLEPVISRPSADAENYEEENALYESKLRELGFTDDSPYYVLTTDGGQVYRVYYGIKDVTGDGYYVRLDGVDTVYATQNAFVGDLLQEDGPESLIEPMLFYPSLNSYAYAFQKSFSVRDYERIKTPGTVITDAYYGVGYTLRKEDGTLISGSHALHSIEGESEASKFYRQTVTDFFLGKSVGECKKTLTFSYPDTEEMGEDRGKSYEIHFETIDYVVTEELRFSLKYLNEDERDLSHKYSVYGFTAPADILNYIPGFDTTASMLQNTMELTGTVVKVGIDEDVLTEYGLYAHQVWLEYPYNDVSDMESYITSRIYVSDVTENGTRYVAETVLFDMVVEVDASLLDYIDMTPLELVDDYVFVTAAEDVDELQMFWNYGEGKWSDSSYSFDITHGSKTNISGEAYATITEVLAHPVGGGQSIAVNPDLYTMLYSRFTYTRYRGEHGLSDEALDALLADADNTCVLRIVMSLSDGVANFLEFYPISADRVAVRVKIGTYGETSCRFVIYRTALDDIYRAYERMMEGKDFDFEDRYE